jgi:hypothetical protein
MLHIKISFYSFLVVVVVLLPFFFLPLFCFPFFFFFFFLTVLYCFHSPFFSRKSEEERKKVETNKMRLTLTFSCLLLPLLLLSVEAQIFNTPKTIIEDSQQLGFIGSYAGISNVKSNLQFESNLLQSEALLLRNNDSIYEKISNFQGNITSSCKFNNSFYFGGEFETINQTLQVHHIVQYNTQTNQFLLLEQSLNGSVYSLYCDEIDEILYIGGNFSLNISNSTANNAISYNFKNNSWSILPWKGFNGPVYTITKNKKLNTILFGGKFDSTMDGQFFNSNTSQIVSLNSPSAVSRAII